MRRALVIACIFSTIWLVYLTWQKNVQDKKLESLQTQVSDLLKHQPFQAIGTSGSDGLDSTSSRLRELKNSFVEMNAYRTAGIYTYGTAGYLGNGYFITVKHGVVNMRSSLEKDKVTSVKLLINGVFQEAVVIDLGDALFASRLGDWAILKIDPVPNLPTLSYVLEGGYDYGDLIYRIGNDLGGGMLIASGFAGSVNSNGLLTALIDAHPGGSGGGVFNGEGELIGISVGRMMPDERYFYRYLFILPLSQEMFRKVRF